MASASARTRPVAWRWVTVARVGCRAPLYGAPGLSPLAFPDPRKGDLQPLAEGAPAHACRTGRASLGCRPGGNVATRRQPLPSVRHPVREVSQGANDPVYSDIPLGRCRMAIHFDVIVV